MRDTIVDEADWVSVHVFYQDNLDFLLVSVLDPLIDELAERGLADECFFLRYWDGGPHLRVRVLPRAKATRDEVENLVCARFARHLTLHPSEDRMSPLDYARFAPVLAEREHLPSYVERMFPNNSAEPVSYRREHHRYGHGLAIGAVERHFTESSRIALRIVGRGASVQRRSTAACAAILLARFADGTGVVAGANTVDVGTDDPDAKGLLRVAELAAELRMLTTDASRSTATGTVMEWSRSLCTLRDALATASSSDMASVIPRGVLDLCAHLFCNRIGVSVQAEHAIRRLAARALGQPHQGWGGNGGLA